MRKYIIISILLILIILSGCNKFLDINRDPDKTEFAPVENFLPGAEAAGLYAMRGNWQVIGAYWSQHWTQAPNAPQFQDYDKFQVGHSTFSRGYGTIFASALKELEYIKSTAEEEGNWALYLIAVTLKAYNYQILVDLFDKVPYTDALKADEDPPDGNPTKYTQPVFDSGDFIYSELINLLDDALSKDFGAKSVIWPTDNDILLGGDETKWKQFANTLKLKLLIRERFADGVDVTSDLLVLLDEDFLSENIGHNYFSNSPDQRNTMYAINFEQAGNISVSNTFLSFMLDGNRDKDRIEALTNPSKEYNKFYGIRQGDFLEALVVDNGDTIEVNDIDDLTSPKLAYDDYQYYFTKPEVDFLLAEAYLAVGNLTDARTFYEQGIIDHFVLIGLDAADANAVILGYASWDNYITDEEKLQTIIEQKWIAAFNIMSLESFIEQNRTGYPDFYTVPVLNVTTGRFPQRFLIPQGEISNNSNTPDDLIGAEIFDEVWWDDK